MQSKGSVILFLAVLAFPVIAISTNHNIFFGVVSLIVAGVSFGHIYKLMINKGFGERESDEDLEAELEELLDIDVKRFGAGLSIAFNLLIILFLFYCAFFLETLVLKGITTFAILMQLHFIIKKVKDQRHGFDRNNYKPQLLLASLLNLAVIVFTVLNKLSRLE